MTLNVEEALRYLGASHAENDLRQTVAAVADELTARIPPRWTWRVFPLDRATMTLPDTDITLPGNLARQMLTDCRQIVLMACTLGTAFDRMMRTVQARDMARAVMLDACGSAWVEAGCDAAEQEIAARLPGLHLTDRFSPGYGDLPLTVQPALCAALDVGRRLGVTLTDSSLMNPQKTVTALIGLADRPQQARIRGCAACAMNQTCALRKGGKHCGV
ncbi:MAG: methionine synthase [Aristaeellaceae bacterium]